MRGNTTKAKLIEVSWSGCGVVALELCLKHTMVYYDRDSAGRSSSYLQRSDMCPNYNRRTIEATRERLPDSTVV